MAVLVDIARVGRGVLAERHCVRSTGHTLLAWGSKERDTLAD